MNILQAAILGIVQGLTEFLPVSSSGHLVIGKTLLGADALEGGPVMELTAHLGSLLAVIIVFRRRLWEMTRHALWGGWAHMRRDGVRAAWWEDEGGRLISTIAVATVPTVIIGLGFRDFFESAFHSPTHAGIGLLITTALLIAAWLHGRNPDDRTESDPGRYVLPTVLIAIVVGMAQGGAIMPGVSRSGATIVAALLLGLRREPAFAFSFLISVPAILGASLFELIGMENGETMLTPAPAITLFFAAFASGWGALLLLRRLVVRGNLGWFAIYTFAVALFAIAWL